MGTEGQIAEMLKNGVVATCDVAASPSLVEKSKLFTIFSSAGMTFGALSGIFDYPQLKFCIDTLGADRIIHSVDFPFIQNDEAKNFIENAPIEQAEKEQIAYKNAEQLFDW